MIMKATELEQLKKALQKTIVCQECIELAVYKNEDGFICPKCEKTLLYPIFVYTLIDPEGNAVATASDWDLNGSKDVRELYLIAEKKGWKKGEFEIRKTETGKYVVQGEYF